jgi:hypothetical protein
MTHALRSRHGQEPGGSFQEKLAVIESCHRAWAEAGPGNKSNLATQIVQLAKALEEELKRVPGPSQDYYLASVRTLKDVAIRAFQGQSYRHDGEVFSTECKRLQRWREAL